MTARERLHRVAAIIDDHGPKELSRWFAAAMTDFETGAARSLDVALGLRSAGQVSPATEAAVRRRNSHLRLAFALVEVDPEASTEERLRALSMAVLRFQASTWVWSRKHPEPPERLPPLHVELWHALKTGAVIPTSTRQLRRLIFGP